MEGNEKRYIVESKFEHNGLQCIVTFCSMGHRCGYVGIDNNHEDYGKDYDSMHEKTDVHGGLTYSDNGNIGYPDYIANNLWWFGFDCAHHRDGKDWDKVKEIFPKEMWEKVYEIEMMFPISNEIIRTKEYVEQECMNLAYQLTKKRCGI